MPAQLTSTWTAPNFAAVSASAPVTSSALVTSHGVKNAWAPRVLATSAPGDLGKSRRATCPPLPRSRSAVAPLGSSLADPGFLQLRDAADNDLGYLMRLYRFPAAGRFDTAIAARLLGVPSLSLEGLLRAFLGVDPGPSRQKDDWSKRPLSAAQETYALNDVLHLISLRDRLAEELHGKGRLAWVEEECAAVAAMPAPSTRVDPDAYLGLNGA